MPASDFYSNTISNWVKNNTLIANIFIAFAYICFAQYGYFVANFDDVISPFWPPFGLVIACAFLNKRRLLVGIFIGAWASQSIWGNHPLAAITIASGVTLSSYVAFYLLRFINRYKITLGQLCTPIWILLASLTSSVLSASVGVSSLFLIEAVSPDAPFGVVWLTWWMGDAIGGLIVAPVIMTISFRRLTWLWTLKLILLSVLCALSYSLIFLDGFDTAPMLFLAFPTLLLACHWFGPAGSAWVTLGFVVFAITSIFIFDSMSSSSLFHDDILLFDFFLFALVTTSLTISTFYQREFFFFPATLFIIGWAFCAWVHHSLKQNADDFDNLRFIKIVKDSERSVEHDLDVYLDSLRASAAYYMNSELIERHEWKNYVSFVNLEQHYPGLKGIGFVKPLKADELSNYSKEIQISESSEFTIRAIPNTTPPPPDELGFSHYIVTHIEPIEKNNKALGLNLASEHQRQNTARIARDSGKATLTSRLQLEQSDSKQNGHLIFLPIYTAGMPIETLKQRRSAFQGWVYAPLIPEMFFKHVLDSRSEQINFTIFNSNSLSRSNYLHGTPGSYHNEAFEHVSNLQLGGQPFTFGWNRGHDFQSQQTYSATVAAASLALGTCLLVAIVVSLQGTNRRVNSLVDLKTSELLQANKDLQKEVYERKKAEDEAEEAQAKAEAASLAKSEFLATMSHEIRTPMNSVIGFSELLSSSDLDEDQKLWTNYIQTSGNSLLHIINDILDISKIEAGKLVLENITFSLTSILNEVTGSFITIAEKKGILLEASHDERIPDGVTGDPIRIKQIITNLTANAIKFTANGGISIKSQWEGNEHSGNAIIQIADTGIGIPKDKISTLFDKFTQVDGSTTREFGGTGLGLAICKQLIDTMGGSIRVNSVQGEGTTMIITLPFQSHLLNSHSNSTNSSNNNNKQDEADKEKIEVLLVDDNAVNQKLGQTILRRLNCTVSLADNGQEAIDAIREKPPAIIFLDCQMPVMDGYEATRVIRKMEQNGEIKPTPYSDAVTIIALTANASSNDREVCLEAGMDDYMRKPCSIKDFKVMLERYTKKS